MTCEACIAASAWPSALFRSGCKGCAARAVARGPQFFRCRTAGRQDREYRALLAAVGVTHEQVLQAAEADRAAKERATACQP